MFIEQAYKGNNTWWRVLITTLCTAGIFIGNFIAYFSMSKEQIDEVYKSMSEIPNNLSLIINLSPFVFLLGLLFLMVRNLHHRSILSLTTSRIKIDYKRILFSFSLVVILTIGVFIVTYFNDNSNIIWNFNPSKFAVLFFISLLFFPCQIGLEEYLFRGYLMQQMGIIVKNRWFPLIFTSVVFGLFHSANPEVARMGYGVMVFYIGTGLLLGIMTLMDESLELALGFHLGNNMMAALLITSDYSAIHTDAVFKYSGVENPAAVLNEMIISIAIVYPIILYIFAKRYNWKDWSSKLTGKVLPPN
ncbi:CPBP family intramembrane metalloprotease [Flavobacterium franklandianum]|uniref:CPBP family intramembrane metalloprotease n=1 Tax=Flavobacterium franklandianum TaxID=2594430 RepID=A0A553CNP1_9FLAO|nr:CPBP family intramembrane glutamic endopeptidase [Flavobacterium franklandianum]TRX22198.1 CPBP family intramembrane metalloprotease [Flavobacterium franklandianum]TRX28956.1 CPBP family intramembrane metalloprotease [Flavobacterium franklandianum]